MRCQPEDRWGRRSGRGRSRSRRPRRRRGRRGSGRQRSDSTEGSVRPSSLVAPSIASLYTTTGRTVATCSELPSSSTYPVQPQVAANGTESPRPTTVSGSAARVLDALGAIVDVVGRGEGVLAVPLGSPTDEDAASLGGRRVLTGPGGVRHSRSAQGPDRPQAPDQRGNEQGEGNHQPTHGPARSAPISHETRARSARARSGQPERRVPRRRTGAHLDAARWPSR